MKTYHGGIIGYGGMGAAHHKSINQSQAFKYVAAFDTNEARRKTAIDNGLKAYASQEQMLASKDIDVILVAAPNNFHKDIAIAAMNAGKHVICEKPVALNSEELEEMLKAADENHVVFTVHQNRRLDKDYQIVCKAYQEGTLGELFRVESRAQGSRGIADTWRRRKDYGGGMLYDWGVHLVDQLLWMIPGSITSVYCEFQYLTQNEVDDNFRLTLNFDNGISALVEIGTQNFLMLPRWYVCGKKGTAQIDYWDCNGGIIQKRDVEIKWEDEIPNSIMGPSRTLQPRGEDTIRHLSLPQVNVDNTTFYNNLVDVLNGQSELFVKHEEIRRVMKVIDLAFESGRKKEIIKCRI